jgi:hypothetical protein
MKQFLFLVLIFLNISFPSYSQPLVVNWQQCYGGSDSDGGTRIAKARNGYFLFGTTNSFDGQVVGNHGLNDYWVIRTDTVGNLLWSKTLGGSSDDVLKQAKPTVDGGFILFGETESNDGDVHGNHGGYDYWIVKIDSLGNLQWQKCLGGSYNDFGEDIDITADSGFICTGWSLSIDGEVTGNHGVYDYWVVKLDKNGNIKWENSFGSSFPDLGLGIISTNDGGAILSGYTGLSDGDVQCNYHGGNADAWIVKLDSTGAIQWQQCYGGSQNDGIYLVVPLTDGGYLCAGNTASNDGQVTGNHGSTDFWVMKIDHSGNLISQKCFGGSGLDAPNFMKASPDGNYIIGGVTYSNDGDVSGFHSPPGGEDMWIIKISPDLDLIWQQCIGGEGNEECYDMLDLGSGKYMLLGYSINWDLHGEYHCYNNGNPDAWLVSVTDTTYIGIDEKKRNKNSIQVYPNPSKEYVVFESLKTNETNRIYIQIFNSIGENVKKITLRPLDKQVKWNVSKQPGGVYYFTAFDSTSNLKSNGKFVIIH